LGQAQKCDSVKPVNGITTLLLVQGSNKAEYSEVKFGNDKKDKIKS
jgi:hypothetical protein